LLSGVWFDFALLLQTKSDLIEEETVLQNPGSLVQLGFSNLGLLQSWICFWVSSSSTKHCEALNQYVAELTVDCARAKKTPLPLSAETNS
jgi:hypothetical protein